VNQLSEFPPVIDSTMLAAYRSCPMYFKQAYIDHWKLQGESVDLHAGAAFAKAMEIGRRAFYVDGMSREDSEAEALQAMIEAYGDFEAPEGHVKSLDRMCGAVEFYYENYPLDTDVARVAKLGSTYAVEFSFGMPLPIKHPVTGQPIIISGKADAGVNYGGGLYIMDEKTTSKLGDKWARQWDLRGQFTCYAWALRQLGFKPAGSIVRGISILKTNYDTKEAIIGQPEWKINRWYEGMLLTVQHMIDDWRSGKWEYNLGESCNAYGSCSFKMCCDSPDPEPWLKTYYEKREWNPLHKH